MKALCHPPEVEARISEFLCFTIYSANLAFGKAYRPILDELGLTYTQYIAIITLWEESPQTVGGLGEKLFLEYNTLTPILKRLETMGYLERHRDDHDQRKVLVSITESGRRLREKGLGMSLAAATGLPPDEFAKVQKAIAMLRDNLALARRLSRLAPD
ncbi:MarR family winged helix-turn-helix transcriptional regulator [Paraburkholderia terrae]|uniref:MarR family transcriptional regulator n=1 Tax=Paraburkholderia terrae TaxID=311230 RepID=A0A2I8F2R6_9BURK|nr:MarR family transcriptional regulator [Paraburkholderia terrae]AUT66063.1 MarR family transcriptional regulator [Paraburkholderia terrae]